MIVFSQNTKRGTIIIRSQTTEEQLDSENVPNVPFSEVNYIDTNFEINGEYISFYKGSRKEFDYLVPIKESIYFMNDSVFIFNKSYGFLEKLNKPNRRERVWKKIDKKVKKGKLNYSTVPIKFKHNDFGVICILLGDTLNCGSFFNGNNAERSILWRSNSLTVTIRNQIALKKIKEYRGGYSGVWYIKKTPYLSSVNQVEISNNFGESKICSYKETVDSIFINEPPIDILNQGAVLRRKKRNQTTKEYHFKSDRKQVKFKEVGY